MFKSTNMKVFLIVTMIAILLTGCGLYGPEETMEIDPPPSDLELQNPELTIDTTDTTISSSEQNDVVTGEQDAKMVTLTVYFFDDKGDIVPLSMDIPKVVGIGQEVLRYMTIGGPAEDILPTGFKPVIPEGTKFTMNVKQDNKLAIIDFSKEFLEYEAKSPAVEKKILDAITWSMTEFPTVEQVEVWVNGYPLEAMPVWNTPIVGPLSRADGINIELANNLDIGQTNHVTLYFSRTNENFNYLVPVTRIIPETDDIARATIEQLILGPKPGSDLASSLLPTTKLLGVQVSDNLLVADFDDEVLNFDDQLSLDLVNMLTYSLAESINVSSFQIKVKGDTAEFSENLSNPIMRPETINAIEF